MADNPNAAHPVGWEAIWRSGDIPPRYRALAAPEDTVVEWADTLTPGASILDLGCGVGRNTIYLGGRGFRMAGQDVSPSGVEQTRAACAERGISFEGNVSDMRTILWADATFDGVFSIAAIHHGQRAAIQQTLAEVRRVLKPGSTLLADFIATSRPEYGHMRELAAAGQVKEVEPNTFVDERDPDNFDAFLPHHYFDEAEARDLLSGFEIVRLWTTQNPVGEPVNPRARWVAVAKKRIAE